MSGPMFPSLLPKVFDPLWFNVDKPCDNEAELSKLEAEHEAWMKAIGETNNDLVPIGKTSEHADEEEEEDEEEDGDDDDSDTNDDDELDTDMIDDRDSPDDAEMEGNDPSRDSPPWGM